MTSPIRAIRLFCIQCMGGGGASRIRDEIRGCTAKQCPLYGHRPYKYPAEEATKKPPTPEQIARGKRLAEIGKRRKDNT